MMEGFKRSYIVDTCYNLIDAPLSLIKLAITKIIETPNFKVTIVDGRTTHLSAWLILRLCQRECLRMFKH